MRSRLLPISALVVVLGSALFLAGMWVGMHRTPAKVATAAVVRPEKSVRLPQKPAAPSAKPADKPSPQPPQLATKPPVPSASGKNVSKVEIMDKEYARGKVVGPSGKPLAGAEITIGGAWVTHAVTGSDGKFRIEVPQLEWKPGG